MQPLSNRTRQAGPRPTSGPAGITIRYKGRQYPAGAALPLAQDVHWWVEYTVTTLDEVGRQGPRGAKPRALRLSLPDAVHYARWLLSCRRPDIHQQIDIYPVDRSLREAASSLSAGPPAPRA